MPVGRRKNTNLNMSAKLLGVMVVKQVDLGDILLAVKERLDNLWIKMLSGS